MINRLLLLLLFLIPIYSSSQEIKEINPISNNLYLQYDIAESLSINYERRITTFSNITLNFNIGISHTQPNYNSQGYKWYGFPIGLMFVVGKRRSHFETGLGYWFQKSYNTNQDYESSTENSFQLKLGYRYQKLNKRGINFRAGLSPTYITSWDVDYRSSGFYIFWYLTVGYSF